MRIISVYSQQQGRDCSPCPHGFENKEVDSDEERLEESSGVEGDLVECVNNEDEEERPRPSEEGEVEDKQEKKDGDMRDEDVASDNSTERIVKSVVKQLRKIMKDFGDTSSEEDSDGDSDKNEEEIEAIDKDVPMIEGYTVKKPLTEEDALSERKVFYCDVCEHNHAAPECPYEKAVSLSSSETASENNRKYRDCSRRLRNRSGEVGCHRRQFKSPKRRCMQTVIKSQNGYNSDRLLSFPEDGGSNCSDYRASDDEKSNSDYSIGSSGFGGEKDSEKFKNYEACYKPGHLSQDVRKAMGLNTYQMPNYIYRMRMIGYPPGWLENAAEVDTSDLYGYPVAHSSSSTMLPRKMNVDKLPEYPGFTSPVVPPFIDECFEKGSPPFAEMHRVANVAQAWRVLESQRCGVEPPPAPSEETIAPPGTDPDPEDCWYADLIPGGRSNHGNIAKKTQPKEPCWYDGLIPGLSNQENIAKPKPPPKEVCWYDGLIPPSDPNSLWNVKERSPVREYQPIHIKLTLRQELIAKNATLENYEGPRNYRVTRELELMEEERLAEIKAKEKEEETKRLQKEKEERRERRAQKRKLAESKGNDDDDILMVDPKEAKKTPFVPVAYGRKRGRLQRHPSDHQFEVINVEDDDDKASVSQSGSSQKLQPSAPQPSFSKRKLTSVTESKIDDDDDDIQIIVDEMTGN